jgi:hypothetical protein
MTRASAWREDLLLALEQAGRLEEAAALAAELLENEPDLARRFQNARRDGGYRQALFAWRQTVEAQAARTYVSPALLTDSRSARAMPRLRSVISTGRWSSGAPRWCI